MFSMNLLAGSIAPRFLAQGWSMHRTFRRDLLVAFGRTATADCLDPLLPPSLSGSFLWRPLHFSARRRRASHGRSPLKIGQGQDGVLGSNPCIIRLYYDI